MNIIDKFGNMVSSATLKDSEKARRLLLAGYRLQEKRLCLFPDRALPSSGRYVAKIVMRNIIQALEEKLEAKLYICDEAQLCGALGAALFAYKKCKNEE